MMKLIFSLTLYLLLSSTARALQCQTCTNPQCSTTALETCSSETMCVTASIIATSLGPPAQQIFKGCASSSLCPTTGSQTFSANLGVSGSVASAECCSTNDCNTATLPFPAQTFNALQCLTCNPVTSQCNMPLQCSGVEDRCFQASVTSGSSTSPAFGCMSANLCVAAASLGSLPFFQSIGSISSGPSCCGTRLCTATTTADSTTTTAPTNTNATTIGTTSDACSFRLSVIHLLLGLIIFAVC